jgi:A/G-specific adenine glycosylase
MSKTTAHFTKPQVRQMQKDLLVWFHENKRDLPFRKERTPFKIWLSEIIMQQTTMSAGVKYYEKFIKKYPSVEKIARAKIETLMKLWEGLGYYNRIRNFHKACQELLKNHAGKMPETYEELIKFSGIGDYVAAAISSMGHNEARVLIDGNVKRILTRLKAFSGTLGDPSTEKKLRIWAAELLNEKKPGEHNEALMELGALVCRPKKPACLLCPWQNHCEAQKTKPENYPVRKKVVYQEVDYHQLLLKSGDKVLFQKPHQESLIKDMWELPTLYDESPDGKNWSFLKKGSLEKIGQVKHSIMDRKITSHIYRASPKTKLPSGLSWTTIDDLKSKPINTLSRKIMKKHLQE